MRFKATLLIAIGMLAVAQLSAEAADGKSGPQAEVGEWRASARKFAMEHFKNPAWGYSHSERDYALAKELAAEDKVKLDDDVLYAACLLHDIAAFEPWADAKRDHSDIGADLVESILGKANFPKAKFDAVRGAIRTHMYYRDPVGPEAIYLHDADALDWLGAIGVARIFGLVDPKGGKPDGPAAVKMIEDNLAKVPVRVFSPAGKAREPARKAELEAYLKTLRSQTQDLRTL
jgi:hypothetical protein